MQIGMIGLGRMGSNMVRRLQRSGHECVVYDGKQRAEQDAETAPLRNPEHHRCDFDLADVTEVWRHGGVISPWLLDLTAAALLEDPRLERFSGRVSESGEGRWSIRAAVDEGAPAPILTTALYQRFSSRGEADFLDRVLPAMRFAFGVDPVRRAMPPSSSTSRAPGVHPRPRRWWRRGPGTTP